MVKVYDYLEHALRKDARTKKKKMNEIIVKTIKK